MEVIVNSPNFYLHIQDAVIFIHYCINGIFEIASQFKIQSVLIIYITVFMIGSLWGSFSNVCIYRLPEGGNIVYSRSECRGCQKKINWFDNIPFVSYIILKGKCRSCGFKISFQYFVVELLVALGFLISFHFFGFR